ncbi:DUF2264 domain-containing protein [Actinoalloteichus caeruleus]|uniref:DUF2264 domain-containing protein n=1 Tax=Actinoalloteichus cyanogriseus TaxID=2893586 RepID=UPI003BB952AF
MARTETEGAVDVSLTGEDRALSPYTGWTRAHWEDLADRLLLAVRPHASASSALVRLPGTASRSGEWSDGLEGFARTFLSAAFRVAGAGGNDPHDLLGWYARGLANGTDPDHPERWPRLTELRQARVEAASVAIALHETRPWLWDRLDQRVRDQVVAWFAPFVGEPPVDSNWVWFQTIVEAFLRSVGGPWSREDIERNCAMTDSWHRGGGWYTDGGRRSFDHYCAWAFHFYPLWYCRMSGGTEPGVAELRARYQDRLRSFLGDYATLVGGDGAPLFQGRSLTYRWATLAPVWTAALFDCSPLPAGQLRRWASGTVRYFLDRGALDTDDLLTTGWHGPFPPLAQWYSGPGSPYWASKGMAGLLLPGDHPVWTAVEEPMAIERGDVARALPAPGWLVSGTSADGIVRVVNHGTDRAATDEPAVDRPVYTAYGFSTATATVQDPDTGLRPGRGLVAEPVDSAVVLLDAEGRPSHRPPVQSLGVRAGGALSAFSRHRAHWSSVEGGEDGDLVPGPWLTVGSVVRGPWEVRLVRVDAPGTDRPEGGAPSGGALRLRITGWPVAGDSAPTERRTAGGVEASAGGLRSLLAGPGPADADWAVGTITGQGRSALGSRHAVPAATTSSVRPGRWYWVVVGLVGDAEPVPGAGRGEPGDGGRPPRVALVERGGQVAVEWPDGQAHTVPLP